MFHLQKYYKSVILEVFPLYFFALKFSNLNMAQQIDWGKGKSVEFLCHIGDQIFMAC